MSISNWLIFRSIDRVKTQTEEAAMKPATPKTELPPSTNPQKVVFGGALNGLSCWPTNFRRS
jgi:hypothetical protein